MRPIPPALRKQMDADPYYQRCAVTGTPKTRAKIDWHHNLIYAGRQVNEPWCIIPLVWWVHERIVEYQKKVDWIMLNRASDEELRRYSKVRNLIRERDELNKIYGTN